MLIIILAALACWGVLWLISYLFGVSFMLVILGVAVVGALLAYFEEDDVKPEGK